MNQSLLLHVVERLEGILHKLPDAIQQPVLREITPLKELFLQQRAPRLLICGSGERPIQQVIATLFGGASAFPAPAGLTSIHRWQETELEGRGKITVLDARGIGTSSTEAIREELQIHAADVLLFVDEFNAGREKAERAADSFTNCLAVVDAHKPNSMVVRVNLEPPKPTSRNSGDTAARTVQGSDRIVATFDFAQDPEAQAKAFCAFISRHLPNEARVELIRISGDRAAQHEIARTLTKSASVICGAIGAQPIPLADLPILTTLQLLLVSGIMYISGRERSLRAATEFVAALGANVGAGMLMREGARALLKFIPGWGNVVCGMIAAGGTFAIGRAATTYFIDGLSLKDARRTYLSNRKRRPQRAYLESPEPVRQQSLPE